MFKQIMKTASACILSAGIGFGVGAAPATATLTDALTQYDQTTIEQDLASVDLSVYAKDGNGRHRLIDEAGFMEYAYSSDASVAEDYFGIYFYVYNPTGREVSSRTGANVVNMAVAYDTEGEPTEYANCAITILDYTDDHLIYKFKLTNSAGAYDRAKVYAAAHDGVRRYDIAGIQLWFSGDANATDEFPSNEEKGISYICSGYSRGCGSDKDAVSTLQIAEEKTDTIRLELEKTFYRTKTSDKGTGYQHQIDAVYFTVPERLFEDYGKLQRIKAEWYEFQTKEIVVTSNAEYYNKILPHIGETVGGSHGYAEDVGFTLTYNYTFYPTVFAHQFYGGWNHFIDERHVGEGGNLDGVVFDTEPYTIFSELYYLFPTKNWCDIDEYDPKEEISAQGGVVRSDLENYIYNYNKTYNSGKLQIGEKTLSADLFRPDIDEDRKMNNSQGIVQSGFDGKSVYDFDVDADISDILSYEEGGESFWDRLTELGSYIHAFDKPEAETGKEVVPIQVLEEGDLDGSDEEISENLLVQISDVQHLREVYDDAVTVSGTGDEKERVVFFRFAVTDYFASEMEVVHGAPNVTHGEVYAARETVFLDFDVIQLTFNDSGDLTVIPVVADPIDIINPITPPSQMSGKIDWALVAILAGLALVSLVGIGLGAAKEK